MGTETADRTEAAHGTEIADRTEAADRTKAAAVIDALGEARERTLTLVESIGDDDLEKVHSTLMSPLVWDLGHIAAFEDLWLVHRFGGKPAAPGSTRRRLRRVRDAAGRSR